VVHAVRASARTRTLCDEAVPRRYPSPNGSIEDNPHCRSCDHIASGVRGAPVASAAAPAAVKPRRTRQDEFASAQARSRQAQRRTPEEREALRERRFGQSVATVRGGLPGLGKGR
jgi:hypothetical protein